MTERRQHRVGITTRSGGLALLCCICVLLAGCGLPTLSQTPTPAGIPVILKPTPTDVPPPRFVTGFNGAVYPTQPMPSRFGAVDIVGKFTHNVVAVPDATMYVLVHWNAQDSSFDERFDADRPTDLDGITVTHVRVNGNVSSGTPVLIDVVFTYHGNVYRTETSITPS